MIVPDRFDAVVTRALQGALGRALRAIADDVPADVRVTAGEGGIVLAGRNLSTRSLTDPRLRDFAGLFR